MQLTQALLVMGIMASGSGTAAFANECDIGTATAFGKYLGEVYCRGAFLPEGDVPPTCEEEAAAYCKDAFKLTTKHSCPTADNKDLYDRLLGQCDGTMP